MRKLPLENFIGQFVYAEIGERLRRERSLSTGRTAPVCDLRFASRNVKVGIFVCLVGSREGVKEDSFIGWTFGQLRQN